MRRLRLLKPLINQKAKLPGSLLFIYDNVGDVFVNSVLVNFDWIEFIKLYKDSNIVNCHLTFPPPAIEVAGLLAKQRLWLIKSECESINQLTRMMNTS